jgi:hypothetical protein
MKYIILIPLVFAFTACNSFIWSKQVYRYDLLDPQLLPEAEKIVERIRERVESLDRIKIRDYEDNVFGAAWGTRSTEIDLRWHPKPLRHDIEPEKHVPILILIYPMWGSRKEVEEILKIIQEEIGSSLGTVFREEIYESHIPV